MEANKQIQIQGAAGKLALTTSKDLLIVCSPGRAIEVFREVRSIPDIFKPENRTPSLFRMRKELGQEKIETYIKIWLVDLCEFLNLNRGMSETQIDSTAKMIIENFGYLTLADVFFVFNNAKMGRYKTMYERLDGQLVLQWFENHFNERTEAAEKQSNKEHEDFKAGLYHLVGGQRVAGDLREKIKKDIEYGKTRELINKSNKSKTK